MFLALRIANGRFLRPRWLAVAIAVALFAACGSVRLSAQQGNNPFPGSPPVWGTAPIDSHGPAVDPQTAAIQRKRLVALNARRQKNMVADAQRLLKLAAELNAQINNSQQSELTPDQLRLLGTIEKLAHSVKDKMSTPITNLPGPYQVPSVAPLSYP